MTDEPPPAPPLTDEQLRLQAFHREHEKQAQAADEAMTKMLAILIKKAPGFSKSHISGAQMALVRFYLEHGSTPPYVPSQRDVLATLIPAIGAAVKHLKEA